MSRRLVIVFIVLATCAAALFARLGTWQLSRHGERARFNAMQASRLDSGETPFALLPRDTALVRFRRTQVAGTWDGAHEVVLAARSHDGSPGAYLLTPVRVAGSDTAVLVNRGWVYSPDGAQVDQPRWAARGERANVRGFVVLLPPAVPGSGTPGTLPVARWIDHAAFAAWAGYPVHDFQVVLTGDTLGVARDSTPVRLAPPPQDGGPHLGYAFQWFAFMTIALVGVPVFLLTRRREAERARAVPPAPHY